jgi:hypothetical protein
MPLSLIFIEPLLKPGVEILSLGVPRRPDAQDDLTIAVDFDASHLLAGRTLGLGRTTSDWRKVWAPRLTLSPMQAP